MTIEIAACGVFFVVGLVSMVIAERKMKQSVEILAEAKEHYTNARKVHAQAQELLHEAGARLVSAGRLSSVDGRGRDGN